MISKCDKPRGCAVKQGAFTIYWDLEVVHSSVVQARRADTVVIVSAFQAFGNYTPAIRGLAAPAEDVSALPGLNPTIPTYQVPS